MKRIATPTLLRKYFAGTAEIGEESKDYVVEPGYALVFHGRIPYRDKGFKKVVAWRHPGDTFTLIDTVFDQPWHAHLKPFAERKSVTQRSRYSLSRTKLACMALARAVGQGGAGEGKVQQRIERVNEHYAGCSEKSLLMEWLYEFPHFYKFLAQNESNVDLSGLHSDFAAGIMQMRISNGTTRYSKVYNYGNRDVAICDLCLKLMAFSELDLDFTFSGPNERQNIAVAWGGKRVGNLKISQKAKNDMQSPTRYEYTFLGEVLGVWLAQSDQRGIAARILNRLEPLLLREFSKHATRYRSKQLTEVMRKEIEGHPLCRRIVSVSSNSSHVSGTISFNTLADRVVYYESFAGGELARLRYGKLISNKFRPDSGKLVQLLDNLQRSEESIIQTMES